MKNRVWHFLVCMLLLSCTACSDNTNQFAQGSKETRKTDAVTLDNNGAAALRFLTGARDGDKNSMYEATNLTTALVEESRDKLVYATRYKQTDEQRKGSETILRISGEIDYFCGTLRKLFPPSTTFRISRTDVFGVPNGDKRFEHAVTITYNKRSEALSDKTDRPVRTMVIRLLQSPVTIDGRIIQSFSFDARGFDRFADRDYEVVSYY